LAFPLVKVVAEQAIAYWKQSQRGLLARLKRTETETWKLGAKFKVFTFPAEFCD